MSWHTPISDEHTANVLAATQRVVAFITARGLPTNGLDIGHTNAHTVHTAAPDGGGPVTETRPAEGNARPGYFTDPAQLVAWARAIGATDAAVSTEDARTVLHLQGVVDGVRYSVSGEVPHVYGERHLPGAEIRWYGRNRRSKHGRVTIDDLERSLAATGHLTPA